jgi:hypothetical protein
MTTVQMLEVSGLKEALKTVNSLDKTIRRQLTKDFENAADPMLQAMRAAIPAAPPLSGFATKSRTQWKKNETKNIKLKLDTRRARNRNLAQGAQYESVGVVKIRTMSPGLALLDMAGKRGSKSDRGAAMVEGLNNRFGNASRIMWPSAEAKWQEVQNNFEPVIKKVESEMTRLLGEK